MDFKSRVRTLLESYNNEYIVNNYYNNEEVIEESIRNNSASNRLKSVINNAEKKLRSANGKEAEDLRKALVTLNKGYEDFLNLENSYKGSDNKSDLKKEYDELKKKYSYQLKRIHMPKGAAAAIIAAALAITGAGAYGANKYANHKPKETVQVYRGFNQKAARDALRDAAKKDYIYKTQAQKNRIEKMETENKAFEEESEKIQKIMNKAELDLMSSRDFNDYNCVRAKINGGISKFGKEDFRKFAKILFSTYGVNVNKGDNVLPAVEFYLNEYNNSKSHNLYNKELTRKNLQERIISPSEQKNNIRRRETNEKLKAHPTSAMEFFL